jgi:hypothetical protein
MRYKLSPVFAVFISLAVSGLSQSAENTQTFSLALGAGTPLHVYLTKRLPKRIDEPVEAKLLDPLFAFDREVAPAGSQVLGSVVRLQSISKMGRAAAVLAGDFTPLHQAEVEFTTLVLPDGRRVPLHTLETPGLNSIADLHPSKKKAVAPPSGVMGTAKAQVQDKIDSTRKNVSDIVRAPDKKERLEDFLWAKLPYHPQRVRRGTRFDAELIDPVPFGAADLKTEDLQMLGSQPPADSAVQAWLVTPLDSDDAKQGDKVEAVISRPLFSADHKLLLPEGTHLTGAVTMAHRARWFHRGGQLRFNFQNIELPAGAERSQGVAVTSARQTLATLQGVETDGKTQVKVDQEGGVKATEPKIRFLAPAIALLVAQRSADNDVSKRTGLPESNTGGRALGGASGFGLLGAAVSRTSPNVASALGYYGLAWSVYTNIIARGSEVAFKKNTAMDVRFGGRAPSTSSKLTKRIQH